MIYRSPLDRSACMGLCCVIGLLSSYYTRTQRLASHIAQK